MVIATRKSVNICDAPAAIGSLLDGWQEKETRASMVFGRCFENALAAYFRKEDCGAALFKEWKAYRDGVFDYKKGETWDRLLRSRR